MAIKIGHASGDERHKATGGQAGDQTGGEVTTRSWYSSPWDVVLRPLDPDIAEKSARACEAACANPHIGYDQGARNTLYTYALAARFDLAKITDDVECDCSSLMHVCGLAGGANVPFKWNCFWTGNMVEGFLASGQYEALRDAKYLTSDAYLKRGDILVNSKSHTAMALENGAKAGGSVTDNNVGHTTTSKPAEVIRVNLSVRQLEKGCKGENVKALQILLNGKGCNCGDVDGDFGDKTRRAVLQFQKKQGLEQDAVVGKNTWHALLK